MKINKNRVIATLILLLAIVYPAMGQHTWQKPKALMPREAVDKIIGPIASKEPSRPLHVVWVWGYDKHHAPGAHDYLRVRDTMVALLRKVPNVTVDTAYEFPTREQFNKADVVIMYLHLPQLTDEQYAMFESYIKAGGGVVALHETAIMRPASDGKKLCNCLGMSWDEGRSKWGAIFEEIAIRNDHIIFPGFPEKLSLNDEFYWNLNRAEGIQVLGEVRTGPAEDSKERVPATELSQAYSPVFWTYEPGKGRVFGTTAGHNTFTYFDPEFRIVLFRAIAWAARELPDPFMPLVFEGITDSEGWVGTIDSMRNWKGKRRGPEQAP